MVLDHPVRPPQEPLGLLVVGADLEGSRPVDGRPPVISLPIELETEMLVGGDELRPVLLVPGVERDGILRGDRDLLQLSFSTRTRASRNALRDPGSSWGAEGGGSIPRPGPELGLGPPSSHVPPEELLEDEAERLVGNRDESAAGSPASSAQHASSRRFSSSGVRQASLRGFEEDSILWSGG